MRGAYPLGSFNQNDGVKRHSDYVRDHVWDCVDCRLGLRTAKQALRAQCASFFWIERSEAFQS